jgi:hypothetical protein
MAGNKHDKYTLILLYKTLFQTQYPADKFDIVLDPINRPISTLPYLPDILIMQDNEIVKWIELGHLPYDKGVSIIEFIGKSRFVHIPYTDPIFSLSYKHYYLIDNDASFNLNNNLLNYECQLIKSALVKAKGKLTQASKLLNISLDSLKYRIKKFNLKGQ